MTWNQIESNWKQLKDNIQQQWAELTETDIDNMSGSREELTGKIQQTYGMDRQNAEMEVEAWQNSQQDFDEGNVMADVSNTMYNNKFGYDETSSEQIQSGQNNRDMPGTNNLSTDGSQISTNASNESIKGTNNLESDAYSANYDGSDANDSNNGISDSDGPGDSGGIPGTGEEEDGETDEFDNPVPNPMPDDMNRSSQGNNQNSNQNSETPHQEKSIDQT